MNKKMFMKKLSAHLGKMPSEERADILADFEACFAYNAQGESEEAVAARLGDPKRIAKEYYSQKVIEEANKSKSFKSMGRAVVASAGLSLANFFYAICVVFVGYIVLGALFIAVVSVGVGGLGAAGMSISQIAKMDPVAVWFGVLGGLGLAALSVPAFIGVMQIGKSFRKGNMRFLNMTRRVKPGRLENEQ